MLFKSKRGFRSLLKVCEAAKLRRTRSHRLGVVEAMEQRILLSTIQWDGGFGDVGGNFDWNNAVNWSTNVLPGANDEVEIGNAFAGITITSTNDVSIQSLTSHASLNVSGGNFHISASSSIAGNFNLSGTLAGTGDLTISGALNWHGGTMAGSGTTTVGPEATLTLDADRHTLNGRETGQPGRGHVVRR